jgi:hypothetical protein
VICSHIDKRRYVGTYRRYISRNIRARDDHGLGPDKTESEALYVLAICQSRENISGQFYVFTVYLSWFLF